MDPFPGYYFTGDGGYMDEDGYVYIMGRVDDVINVAGHRLSTGAMEEVIATHPDVAECAVIGAADEPQGPGAPRALSCSRRASTATERGHREGARADGPRPDRRHRLLQAGAPWSSACPRPAPARSCAAPCARSPTARSTRVPSTIDDPAILGEIEEALQGIGYAKKK